MEISVIVPTYNDREDLEKCLSAISKSSYKPYEVIVVDDASIKQMKDIVDKYNFKYKRLRNNSGQATARNVGAKLARGNILFFIDSNVVIRKNTIEKVAKAYKRNPNFNIYQGIASKIPVNKGFGPKLFALKWYFELSKIRKASFVYSHVFSIKKDVFNEVGGFNERFKPPGGGEEFDLGHRLRKKYIVHTDPKLLVEHKFQNILPRTLTLYRRSYVYASL